MKIQHVQKIIQQIQQEITCPNCAHTFTEENVEIKKVHGNHIEFVSLCLICKYQAQISADVKFAPMKNSRKSISPPQLNTLSPQSIKNISQSLKTFKAKDIKHIFNN